MAQCCYLSAAERQAIEQLNDPNMNKWVIEGDEAHKKNNHTGEAIHRDIQEELRKRGIILSDPASKESYGKNSAMKHHQIASNWGNGLPFDQVFQRDYSKPGFEYRPLSHIPCPANPNVPWQPNSYKPSNFKSSFASAIASNITGKRY